MNVKFLIILTLALSWWSMAEAQECAKVIDASEGNMVFRNSKGEDLIQMEGKKNSFSLFISGFEFSFGSDVGNNGAHNASHIESKLKRTMPSCKASGRCSCGECQCKPPAPANKYYEGLYASMRQRVVPQDYLGSLELGMNGFKSPGYGMYDDVADHGFLDLNTSKSIHVTWNVIKLSRNITRNGKLGFSAGWGFTWNNYVFDKNITIARGVGGVIYPQDLDKEYKKSKLTTFSPRLTAVVGYKLGLVRVAGGVYGEYVARAFTKYKKPTTKYSKSMLNIEQWQAGLTARVGFKYVKVFANYQLTNYFKHNKGPETSVYTIGLTLF